MLFDIKLAEIERHITYIRAACETRRADAHPNLAARLYLTPEAGDDHIPAVDAVRQDFMLTRPPLRHPAVDDQFGRA